MNIQKLQQLINDGIQNEKCIIYDLKIEKNNQNLFDVYYDNNYIFSSEVINFEQLVKSIIWNMIANNVHTKRTSYVGGLTVNIIKSKYTFKMLLDLFKEVIMPKIQKFNNDFDLKLKLSIEIEMIPKNIQSLRIHIK